MKILLLIAAIVTIALAQAPSPPTWPNTFSATVGISDSRFGTTFVRWFYDATVNKDRWDGTAFYQGETYFATRIFDHNAEIETDVFYQLDFAICLTRQINGTSLPKPSFTNISFIGVALIDYEPVYHWIETNQNGTFQYFDTVAARETVRLDWFSVGRQDAISLIFYEFDETSQDTSLFDIPSIIQPQCTPVTGVIDIQWGSPANSKPKINKLF